MSKSSPARITEKAGAGVKILIVCLTCIGLVAGLFWYARHGMLKNPGTDGNRELSGGTGRF
ncbi:MAG: hypothetical protein WDM80_10465 [Limisphaerales bacterium]